MSDNPDTEQSSDIADRLHILASAMVEALPTIKVEGRAGNDVALWKALPALAKALSIHSDRVLRDQYLSLCSSVSGRVEVLRIRRVGLRESWLKTIGRLVGAFDAKNYGEPAGRVFSKHMSADNLATLAAISNQLLDTGLHESSLNELEDAFAVIGDAIEEIANAGDISDDLVRVLKHLLHQMKTALSLYDVFGDDQFWRAYRETISIFVQAHTSLIRSTAGERIKEKMGKAAEVLSRAFSTGANVATIGSAAWMAISASDGG